MVSFQPMVSNRLPAGIARAAVAALCLSLLPCLAAAQTADDQPAKAPAPKKKKATRKPAAKEAEKAAPADAAAPAPAPRAVERPAPRPVPHAAPRPPPDPSLALLHRLELGGSIGLAIPFESGINTGFKLDAAGFYGFMPLAPNVILQLGGHLGWAYHSAAFDSSLMLFDILPAARARMTINPKVFVYGEVGAGLGLARASVSAPGVATQSKTDTAFLLKLGGGAGYDLNPQLSLVGEPALCIYAKDGSTTELTLMVGVLYRP
jgi:hypothetical protein